MIERIGCDLDQRIRQVFITDALKRNWKDHQFCVTVHSNNDISIIIDDRHDISYDGDVTLPDLNVTEDILSLVGEYFLNVYNE